MKKWVGARRCTPAHHDEELDEQQGQVLLLRLQPHGHLLHTLQEMVPENLQDVVWQQRHHWGNLLQPAVGSRLWGGGHHGDKKVIMRFYLHARA